jgi:hypothetical protein
MVSLVSLYTAIQSMTRRCLPGFDCVTDLMFGLLMRFWPPLPHITSHFATYIHARHNHSNLSASFQYLQIVYINGLFLG